MEQREGRAEPILIKVAVMEDNLISGGEMRQDYPNHPPPHMVPRALLSLEVVTIKTKGWVFTLGP